MKVFSGMGELNELKVVRALLPVCGNGSPFS